MARETSRRVRRAHGSNPSFGGVRVRADAFPSIHQDDEFACGGARRPLPVLSETPTLTTGACVPPTTMTPVVLLVVFCATMTVIAIGRLTTVDDRDPVEAGTALIVAGITLLTVLWVALEEAWLAPITRLSLASFGGGLLVIGLFVVGRYWDGAEPSIEITDAGSASRSDAVVADRDGDIGDNCDDDEHA